MFWNTDICSIFVASSRFLLSYYLLNAISWQLKVHVQKKILVKFEKVLILAGLEPAIPWFVVRCLIHWATGPDVVEPPLSFSFITPIFNMQYSLGHIASLIDTTASINWIKYHKKVSSWDCQYCLWCAILWELTLWDIDTTIESICDQKPFLQAIILQYSSQDLHNLFLFRLFAKLVAINSLAWTRYTRINLTAV